MNKLEVGMYVRTKKGIKQIYEIDNNKTKWKYLYKLKKQDGDGCVDCGVLSDEDILKASHSLLGNDKEPCLIEVGDYVNGYPVAYITDLGNEFGKRLSFGDETCVVASKFNFDKVYIYKEDIKSIVTKEQFSSMEYRLGE